VFSFLIPDPPLFGSVLSIDTNRLPCQLRAMPGKLRVEVTQAASRMSRKPGRRHRPLREKLLALETGENPAK
jgi:hypothetical protein